MASQTLTRGQALQRAVQVGNNRSWPEAKRIILEVLKQSPLDVPARALLRSIVSKQMRGGTADFANRFEQEFMSDPNTFLKLASKGWFYALTLEEAFIDPSLERRSPRPKPEQKSPFVPPAEMGNRSADEILSSLMCVFDPRERWKEVLALASSNERVVVEDSFASVDDAELHDQLAGSLRNEGFNIVIIGG